MIATGEYHTVREFTHLAFEEVGITLRWETLGVDEKGIDTATTLLPFGHSAHPVGDGCTGLPGCRPPSFPPTPADWVQSEQRDLSDFTLPCLEHYHRRLGLEFRCVYSGFSSQEQIDHCLKFFSTYQDALAVVDPVMGDHGRPYRTITPQMRNRLGELVRVADIITPNLTEACMLLKIPYFNEGLSRAQAKSLLVRLSELGPNYVVITGAPMASGSIANIGYDRQNNSFWYIDCDYVPVSIPGPATCLPAC